MLIDLVTGSLPGVGGVIRQQLGDFYVEEIPAYHPTGTGQHTLFEIEKQGIDTYQAVRALARELGVSQRLIGLAGLKDARAVSRQHLSVEGIDPQRLLGLELPKIRVLWAEKHRNRLKIGHLRGNKFVIRIRDVPPDAVQRAGPILDFLALHGLANGFGLQRFGARGTTHYLGQALLHNNLETFFAWYLGHPLPPDTPEMRASRESYDNGDIAAALQTWPYPHSDEYRVLSVLARRGSIKDAYYSLPHELLRLSIAAFQAYLFNRLLQERLSTYDEVEEGDLAYKHINGACFLVTDAAIEQERAANLEISATAPLFGRKVRLAEGLPGERERRLLHEEGLTLEDLRPRGTEMEGDRRPLRVPVTDLSYAQDEEGMVVSFSLPPGAYATNLLREVMHDPYLQ